MICDRKKCWINTLIIRSKLETTQREGHLGPLPWTLGKGWPRVKGKERWSLTLDGRDTWATTLDQMPDPRTVPGTGQGLRGEGRFEEGVKGIAQLQRISKGLPWWLSGKGSPAMPEMWVPSLDMEDPLEEEMEAHFSVLTWRIPWTEATVWQAQSSSVQVSCVWLFATPWTAACQDYLSIINTWSLLRLMFIESVMPSNHFILCCPLLLLPSIFLSIGVFLSESVLCIKWPKDWSFSCSPVGPKIRTLLSD